MRCGSGLNRFCRERQRTPAGRRIIGCFLKRCCGVSARDRRHEPVRAGSSRVLWEREPCRPALSSVPLSGGCRRGFLSVVSACYPTNSIGRSYRWMGRSCKPMPRPPGRKKGLLRRHRAFKSIHDGVQPPKSTFLRLFCVFRDLIPRLSRRYSRFGQRHSSRTGPHGPGPDATIRHKRSGVTRPELRRP